MLDYYGQAPIIVRSSSLLEDSFGNMFAGQYETIFLPNQGPRAKRLARFLFVYPKSNIGYRDVINSYPIAEEVENRYAQRITDLLNITRPGDPLVLHLSPGALVSFQGFERFIEENQKEDRQFASFADFTGKLPGAAARIAGLFHAAQHGVGNSTIDQATMESALDLCHSLIPHAQKTLGTMAQIPEVEDAKHVWKWISQRIENEKESTFTLRECHRALHAKFPTAERLRKALHELMQRNFISQCQSAATAPTGGRPSAIYGVNPRLAGAMEHAA